MGICNSACSTLIFCPPTVERASVLIDSVFIIQRLSCTKVRIMQLENSNPKLALAFAVCGENQ